MTKTIVRRKPKVKPLKIVGKPPTARETAHKLGMSDEDFDKLYVIVVETVHEHFVKKGWIKK